MNENSIPAEYRDIQTITAEIRTIKNQAAQLLLCSYVALGRRLTEAKALLPHGEWGNWLRDEAEFSQQTANNMMNIYEQYGSRQDSLFGDLNSQALGNLSYTKAVLLLKVPEDEREEFAETNKIENLSTRELDRLIKEKEAAEKRAADAEEALAQRDEGSALAHAELEDKLNELRDAARDAKESAKEAAENERTATRQLQQVRDSLRDAQQELEALRNRPPEKVADPDAIAAATEKARLEATKELAEKVAELQRNLTRAEADAEKAKKTAEKLKAKADGADTQAAVAAQQAEFEANRLREENDKLKKQLAVSDSDTAAFKVLFEELQGTMVKLFGAWDTIHGKDAEKAKKLGAAVIALCESVRGKVGAA